MKKIAIVGWKTGDNSFGTTIPYLEYFSNFGEVIILTPQCEVRDDLDLLVLPGGKDVNPARYGEVPSFRNTDINPFLESFDMLRLPGYIENGTPIFGICRGFQTLNIHFGGSMTQHYIHAYSTKSRDELVHDLNVISANVPQPVLEAIPHKQRNLFKTNSIHHQVVFKTQLSAELKPTLFESKDEDPVIEGFIHRTLPIAGVQYHPEEIYERYSIAMIRYLLTLKNN